jgi:hypothetical protein
MKTLLIATYGKKEQDRQQLALTSIPARKIYSHGSLLALQPGGSGVLAP